MSLAHSQPTPSKAPEPERGPEVATNEAPLESSHKDHPRLPTPTLRVELRDLRHEATKVFLDHVNAATDIANMVDTVNEILYYPPKTATPTISNPSSSTDDQKPLRPHPFHPHIPPTRSVTFVLRDMDGVAYTTGLELDDDHKEIHFSLSYIASVAKRFTPRSQRSSTTASSSSSSTSSTSSSNQSSTSSPSLPSSSPTPSAPPSLPPSSPSPSFSPSTTSPSIRAELLGVICHELVHCYQWNALGSAPGGLIEGIADFVRLRAGFVPPHWKREGGKKWDAGYQTTGYFLDWLEGRCGEGAVRRLNEAMRGTRYEKGVWRELFGEDVGTLWGEYCGSLKE
ncbi:hypothetical protein KVT40_004648 [Elsinoe batatas]|uniref:Uncharacterized protein n=1 Tax=Elsinoe batatas TaxID=2601811 RepID=A0A8K0PCP4_9PEZI|nr:hypothetical protein KVT40_004648 [Elsinoe batatas]